ncbi:hypothetical protein O3M35_012588 [Rhynocoris fuscipes]|uniref:Uncharacterized protein n=1 Tax=Rhynocoris fuscipes TaxID=488301 RepID=A0AAW1D086_9HEMI
MSTIVKDYLLSLLNCSKYLGLFPFNISVNNGAKLSIYYCIWSLAMLVLLSYVSVEELLIPIEFVNFIYKALVRVQLASLQIALNIHVLWLIVHRDSLQTAFTILMNMEYKETFEMKASPKYPIVCYIMLVIVYISDVIRLGLQIKEVISLPTFLVSLVYHFQAGFLFSAIFQTVTM